MQPVLKMGYVYDASTRSYKQTSTTATKAVSGVSKATAKIFSKVGSQLAPTATFYQSAAKVTISPQAKQLASGVKTTFEDALKSTGLQNATIYLERTVTKNGTTTTYQGLDLLKSLTASEFDKLASLSQQGSISFRFPPGVNNTIDVDNLTSLTQDTDLNAEPNELKAILNRFDGSFSLSVKEDAFSNGSAQSTMLQAVRDTLGKANRISNFKIYDNNGLKQAVSISADAVTQLGSSVWAKFPGSMSIRDSVANIASKWSDLRVLNNYKTLNVTIPDGIIGNNQVADLKQFDFNLDYQSFISGYNFLRSINRQPEAINLVKTTNTTSDQSFVLSGKLRNRDLFSLSISTTNPAKTYPLTVPPLGITPTATSADRVAILTNALKTAVAAEPALADVTVSNEQNKFSFKSTSTALASVSFNQEEVGENDITNFVDVTNVPIYALSSLQSVSEIRSITLSTNITSLKSNWDLVGAFNRSRPLKDIVLSEKQDIDLTAQDVTKYLPVIEKISGTQFRISDFPFAMTTYGGFTEEAANKLSSAVDLKGTVADFVKSASGIASLSKAGKLRSLEITGTENSVIPLDIKSALSLASVLNVMKDTLKIQITDKASLADAALLAQQGIAQSLVGTITIESDGSDLTSDNVRDAKTLSNETLTVTRSVSMASAVILSDLKVTPTAPLKIQDSVANLLAKSSSADAKLISTIVLSDSANMEQATALSDIPYASKILSGIRVSDSFVTIDSSITALKTLKTAGLLREIAVPLATSDVDFAALKTKLAIDSLGSYLTRAAA